MPQMISNVFSATNKYLNSNNAIASGLVAINGSSPKMTKYPFMPAPRKMTPKNTLQISSKIFMNLHTSLSVYSNTINGGCVEYSNNFSKGSLYCMIVASLFETYIL